MLTRLCNISRVAALLLLAGSPVWVRAQGIAPSAKKADDPVVLSVGDDKLTRSEVDKFLSALPQQSRMYFETQGRGLLPQYLVRMKILAAEAKKQHLEGQPEVQREIEFSTQNVLAEAARKRLQSSIPVSPEEVKQAYERRKPEFEQVRFRHILVRTENSILGQSSVPKNAPVSSEAGRAKIESLRKQVLDGGASFEELAKANSDDTESAARGGDIGFVSFQDVIPPIWQAAMTLEPGKVSEVISTPFGLELIQLVEKRPKPLEEVAGELEGSLRQAGMEFRLQELQEQYKVFVDPAYFSGEAPTAPTGADSPAKTEVPPAASGSSQAAPARP